MDEAIKIVVYGEPVAQGRPRATTINGHVRMYDPKKSSDYKNYVRFAASQQAGAVMEGAVKVTLTVYRPTPKSFSNKRAEMAERGGILPTTKPDLDNYIKSIKDALKGVVWRDDSQVTEIEARKMYSKQPRVEVEIRRM